VSTRREARGSGLYFIIIKAVLPTLLRVAAIMVSMAVQLVL